MLADLDLLLTYVFCVADDLLPEKPANHRRSLSDAEVVTLAVAQSIMGIPSDYRFIRTAIKQLHHLFPGLTKRSGYFKRRDRLADTIEWLIPMFASQSPGWDDNLLLADSTPVECARYEQLSNVVDEKVKHQAATFSSVVVVSSSVTLIPSLNFTSSSTSATSSWPLTRRQRSWAASSSL